MITKGRKRVIFRLEAPDASDVWVVGDFNNWDLARHPLNKKPGGAWEKTMLLLPGRYEYKFKVDGDWRIDPCNASTCVNGFGTRNSVIEIGTRVENPEISAFTEAGH